MANTTSASAHSGNARSGPAFSSPAPAAGDRIVPGQPWDLGHDDIDRSRCTGPEHAACNRAAAARKGHARKRALGEEPYEFKEP